MLESGVDRIITQVVDPKMNHTFRPQIETAIHDILSGDRKEENSLGCTPGPPEPTETLEPPSASGPKTPWGFAFKPNIQLKDTGNFEILRSVISCGRNTFLAVYTVLHTFSVAQNDVTRTNEKRRAWSCWTITGKVRRLVRRIDLENWWMKQADLQVLLLLRGSCSFYRTCDFIQ